MTSYDQVPDFARYYLEDSYVLGVTASPGQLTIRLELVLTPEHPEYRADHPGEQHCYRDGRLQFDGVTTLSWAEQGRPPATDAEGEADYGNIDSWLIGTDGEHVLAGNFGRIQLTAKDAQIVLD